MSDPIQTFKDELNDSIKKRKKYECWDFRLSHAFLWLSILASFSSSIIIANGVEKEYKILISAIAGIPGLIVVIDKTFDFAKRTAWDTMYKIDMQELKDKVDFGKMNVYMASRELRELNRKHESSFLRIGFFAKNKDKIIKHKNNNTRSKNSKYEPR